ncbi:Uncharacterised protein [Salmonella enterica subsp. enterica serovar Typhi]|nr:Uncharacterised protein [Salmonella enterica subsp. enterica serovar Typhi]
MMLSQWIMVRAASCASPFRVLKITGGKHFSGFDACDTTDCFVVEPTDDGLERARVVGWREVV